MAKTRKRSSGLSSLRDLEVSMENQSTVTPSQPKEPEKTDDKEDKVSSKQDEEKNTTVPAPQQKIEPKTKEALGKKFEDFFNKDYSTKDAEPIMVHKDLKNILEKISGGSSGTTQSSLASNILSDWIIRNKKQIEKILREQNKINI